MTYRIRMVDAIIAVADDLPQCIVIRGEPWSPKLAQSIRAMLNRRGFADVGLFVDPDRRHVWATMRKG